MCFRVIQIALSKLISLSSDWNSFRCTVQIFAFCQVIVTLQAKETKPEDPNIHILQAEFSLA